jgi:hypothetical protein
MLDEHKRRSFDAIVWTSALLFAAVLPVAASADGHRYTNENPSYRAECGSCHVAYPPGLLGADAWRTIMNGLDKHFGTDASIEPGIAAEISAFLERNAGTGRRPQDPPASLRITESRWFVGEHNEVPAATWKRPAVKSAANCAACHTLAEQGDFRERNIRIPR